MVASASTRGRGLFRRRGLVVWLGVVIAAGSLAQTGPGSVAGAVGQDDQDVAATYHQSGAHNAVNKVDSAVPPLVEAWSDSFPAPVSYAVIGAGRAYVVSSLEQGWGSFLYAMDANTGRKVWGPIDLGTAAENYPITYDNGSLFVETGQSVLVAFDALTGKRQWAIGGNLGKTRYQGDLAPWNGALYTVAYDQYGWPYVQAVSEADGVVLWSKRSPEFYLGWASTDGQRVYVGFGCSDLFAYSTVSGEMLWSSNAGCDGGVEPAVVANDRLYVTEGGTGAVLDAATGVVLGSYSAWASPVVDGSIMLEWTDPSLIAVDAETGETLWSFDGDGALVGAPAVVQGTVYIASQAGSIFGLDETTGVEVWKGNVGHQIRYGAPQGITSGSGLLIIPGDLTLTAYRNEDIIPPPPLPRRVPRFKPPAIQGADEAVAFQIDAEHDGSLTADTLKPPLRQAWATALPGLVSYPIIADGKVIVTVGNAEDGQAYLYGFDQTTGEEAWPRVPLDPRQTDFHYANAAYGDGTVYAVDALGQLTAVNASTGQVVWTEPVPDLGKCADPGFAGPPTIAGGHIYLAGNQTEYALQESTGQLVWDVCDEIGGNASPSVDERAVYWTNPCVQSARDPATGDSLWRHHGDCWEGDSSIASLSPDGLYARVNFNIKLNPRNGRVLAGFTTRGAIPALAGSLGYFLTNGVLRAEDLSSGTVMWSTKPKLLLSSAAIVINGVVYIGSSSGQVYGLDARSGRMLWQAYAGAPIPPSEGSNYGVTGFGAGGGMLVVPAENKLIAYTQ
jgi:outer membrane protein assembly factor BamB